MKQLKIINVVGARPNFIKIAPIIEACKATKAITPILIHTGQHYSRKMSDLFFHQLGIPEPDINLGIGSASHAVQTAEIMKSFEPVLLKHKPDAAIVVGDVNSTIACALVTVKLGIKLVHVEAGLRSFDRSMPEEINRTLTDRISDLLFCTEKSAVNNLISEGVPEAKIFLVGNVMIDTLNKNRLRSQKSKIFNKLSLNGDNFAVLTLHRPSNVDDHNALGRILDALEIIQNDMLIVFPVHPRTLGNFTNTLKTRLRSMSRLIMCEPLGYLDFLKLLCKAKLVLTDSGGVQEETTVLNVPCLTLRDNTERPVTLEMGTNRLVGSDTKAIVKAYHLLMNTKAPRPRLPPLWDGKASNRIVKILLDRI